MKNKMHSHRIKSMEYCKKHSPEYYNRFMRKEHEDFLINRIPEINEERRKRFWGKNKRYAQKSRTQSRSTR